MIDISGHLRNSRRENGYEDNNQPIIVNCCGYQSFSTQSYAINRENGRLDYQLIYIYQGCGHYKINDTWNTLKAGSIVLFHPLQSQTYYYKHNENPQVFWIHFTGYKCKEIIKNNALCNCNIGVDTGIKSIFEEIILELQVHKPYFENIVEYDFYKLISYMQRVKMLKNCTSEQSSSLENLIVELNKQYMNEWTISSMADFCFLSNDYFAHNFKKLTGLSPIKFLTNIRIEKAKEFLSGQGLSVNTVAKLTGFEDPLYFSRVFKKSTGLSPRKYRNQSWD